MSRILVVAAHPDDEVLGCGGTIARHVDSGDQVQVLIVAEGSTSRQKQRNRTQVVDELSALVQATQVAGSILGATGVELHLQIIAWILLIAWISSNVSRNA